MVSIPTISTSSVHSDPVKPPFIAAYSVPVCLPLHATNAPIKRHDRAICWWTLGHGFAYGKDLGGFIGTDDFAFTAARFDGDKQGLALAQWFFQWAFAGERA